MRNSSVVNFVNNGKKHSIMKGNQMNKLNLLHLSPDDATEERKTIDRENCIDFHFDGDSESFERELRKQRWEEMKQNNQVCKVEIVYKIAVRDKMTDLDFLRLGCLESVTIDLKYSEKIRDKFDEYILTINPNEDPKNFHIISMGLKKKGKVYLGSFE